MIFDDPSHSKMQDSNEQDGRTVRRRRRRSSPSSGSQGTSRRRSRSSFRDATLLPDRQPREEQDRSPAAWLAVLGLLVVCAAAFAWYLHQERSGLRMLGGEAPSEALVPFIDPILAPLETGESGFSPESLSELAARFRSEKEGVGIDDKEIYSIAATVAEILREAVEDRSRHIERLVRIGVPVQNSNPDDGIASARLTESERKRLEVAVGISWHRNSGAYRNRIEELGMRLVRLEQGRFRSAAATEPVPAEESTNP